MGGSRFAGWRREFEDASVARARTSEPDWGAGAQLPLPLVRSVQRFQVGEAGDGRNLLAKAEATGDADYAAATRLFVAEEQDHARMLALLLEAAGQPTVDGHWTDTVFVRSRRALGLRIELLVLMVAEVVALTYYRALRDRATDPLAAEVGRRILDDERRHVPFHCAALCRMSRSGVAAWRTAVTVTAVVVAVDHGPALRALGESRHAFVRDVRHDARRVGRELRRYPAIARTL